MDLRFCKQLENETRGMFEKTTDVYINSCYRLTDIEDSYAKFKPEKDIEKTIKKTTKKFTTTYGLHIRQSDHETSKKISTVDKFVKLIDQILEDEKETTFFLSTDNPLVKSKLIKNYGDKIIFNEISSYDRNSPKAIKDALLDLFCLASTRTVYGSHHSSFSQVAAEIGKIPEITVK